MKKTLIIIGGATASGKTSLAIDIAQVLKTSILNADSRQCYKELNIGVAKPTNRELELIQHYFINTNSIFKIADAAIFEKYGLGILDSIFEHNDFAVCAGGTGLYIKALCDGLDKMPEVSEEISKSIQNEYDLLGIDWLRNEINKTDLLYANHGNMDNPARMLRALAFYKSIEESILNYRTGVKKRKAF